MQSDNTRPRVLGAALLLLLLLLCLHVGCSLDEGADDVVPLPTPTSTEPQRREIE